MMFRNRAPLTFVLLAMGCDPVAITADAGPLRDAAGLDAPGSDAAGEDTGIPDDAGIDATSVDATIPTDAGPSTLALPDLPLPPALGPRFPDGIEPGDPSECEAAPPARCWWVDADAPAGGDGSYESPASSFESIVGTLHGSDYSQGSIGGGDYLYVRGTFDVRTTDDPDHTQRILMRRASQGGTVELPTVIKSWRGSPRAVFDGGHESNDMIMLANMLSIRIANIEIANANGRGLSVESLTGTAIFEDMVVRDTIGDGEVGVGGGLHFYGGPDEELIVRHCHFHDNDRDAFGAINNIGALSITSDLLAPEHGSLIVYRNVFQDETTGVRHKHAGSIDTEIYENLFWGGGRGVVLRSFRSNEIHHNVFLDLEEAAIVSYIENTNGELMAEIHHNDFFDTTRLVEDVVGLHDHDHHLDFHHNFFHGSTSSVVFAVSTAESLPFITSSTNLYVLADGASFSRPSTGGGDVGFAAFSASVGDTTSTLHALPVTGSDDAAHRAVYEAFAAERDANDIGF